MYHPIVEKYKKTQGIDRKLGSEHKWVIKESNACKMTEIFESGNIHDAVMLNKLANERLDLDVNMQTIRNLLKLKIITVVCV